jgi:hypothetical protein
VSDGHRAPVVAGISPEPTEEEAAAIAAAVVAGLPSGGEPPAPPAPPRWRFSGRWWSAPVSSRRARP